MRRTRLWVGVALLISTGLGTYGCSDSPTSIEPEQEIEALPVRGPAYARVEGVTLGVLRWNETLPSDLTDSRWIGRWGGMVRLRDPGVSLFIPPGALKTLDGIETARRGKVKITMTLHEGGGVSVGFGPDGIRFSRPAYLVIDLKDTQAADDPSVLDGLVAVYFKGKPGQTVQAREVLPVRVIHGKLIVPIQHFSGYLLASG